MSYSESSKLRRLLVINASGLATSLLSVFALRVLCIKPLLEALPIKSFVLPLGAVLVALPGATGYAAAARRYDQLPPPELRRHVVLGCLLTQWLIYFLPYLTVSLPDGTPVSSAMSFWQYLFLAVRNPLVPPHALPVVGSTMSVGALIALGLQVLLCLFLYQAELSTMASLEGCERCQLFMRFVSTLESKTFANTDDYVDFIDRLESYRPFSPQYMKQLGQDTGYTWRYGDDSVSSGEVLLTYSLYQCQSCQARSIHESLLVGTTGDKWKDYGKRIIQEGKPVPPARRLGRERAARRRGGAARKND